MSGCIVFIRNSGHAFDKIEFDEVKFSLFAENFSLLCIFRNIFLFLQLNNFFDFNSKKCTLQHMKKVKLKMDLMYSLNFIDLI